VYDAFGGPEVLRVVDEPVPSPGPGEVRVRIEAFAVNPLDVMMRAGTSPAPVAFPGARLGIEGTGVVDELGEGVTGLAVGAPVILSAVPDATTNGSYADYVCVPAQRVIARPEGLDVAQSAAVWVGFSTAYGALVEKAGMRPGDTILVNAASGSVGRAAIGLARQLGAVPVALTRQVTTRVSLLDAGAAAVVVVDNGTDGVTDSGNLAAVVQDITHGQGADIVLDLVDGPGQADLVTVLRPGGVLVAAGFFDLRPASLPFAPITIHRYRGFEHTLDPVVVRRMAASMHAGVRLGAVRPLVDRAFAFDDVAAAQRHLEAGAGQGKTVIVT